jgi:hypothetical protein
MNQMTSLFRQEAIDAKRDGDRRGDRRDAAALGVYFASAAVRRMIASARLRQYPVRAQVRGIVAYIRGSRGYPMPRRDPRHPCREGMRVQRRHAPDHLSLPKARRPRAADHEMVARTAGMSSSSSATAWRAEEVGAERQQAISAPPSLR